MEMAADSLMGGKSDCLVIVLFYTSEQFSWSRTPGVHIFELCFAIGDHEDRLELPAWNYFEVRVSELYW